METPELGTGVGCLALAPEATREGGEKRSGSGVNERCGWGKARLDVDRMSGLSRIEDTEADLENVERLDAGTMLDGSGAEAVC